MWTVVTVAAGALLAVAAALGLVNQKAASTSPVDSSLVHYGTR